MRRLCFRWLVGAIAGTALIALTSPLFLRSYLIQRVDPVRGVAVLPAAKTYRWRSEGYANTRIGPYGMPGKTTIFGPRSELQRIALWGDSQAEGVCVADAMKLFAQVEQYSDGTLEVFPLARSGDGLADWITQMPAVETELQIDRHVLLIQDLADLWESASPTVPGRQRGLRAILPAIVIQAARNLVTQQDGNQLRQLRFAVGPTAPPPAAAAQQAVSSSDWQAGIEQLKLASSLPTTIIYVPPAPRIAFGQVTWDDRLAAEAEQVQSVATANGIQFINAHATLCGAARIGCWPHGFHNGQIGNGHLNADGYALIAKLLIEAIGQR